MKIAFILPSFPCTSETFILTQIVEFVKMGHDVTIYAMSKPANSILHQEYIKYRLDLKTKYAYSIPCSKFRLRTKAAWGTLIHLFKAPKLFSVGIIRMLFSNSKPFDYKNLFLFLLLGSQKNDILFCHFGTMGNMVAFLKKLGLPGPLVTMFHGYDIRLGIEKGGEIYKELFDVGQCFLAISEYNKKHLIEFGVPPHKLVVHPVGINIDFFPLINNQITGAIQILTVARLVPEKGLHYAIQAIRELLQRNPDLEIQYNIIGDGPLEDSLKEIVSTLKLNNIVHFLGAKTQSEIKQYLAKSNIFLLSSVAEALPVCLMEAQVSGLPVVATNVGSIDQIIKDGKSGFLAPPKKPLFLCEKLEYLINHRQLWPQFGKSGREHVQKNFDNHILCKKLLRIFEDLHNVEVK